VCRLLEEEGIFYWFRHEEDKHVLVLADYKSAHQDCVEAEVDYCPGSLVPNNVTSWEHAYEFRPGKYAQTDYNFETPGTSLLTQVNTLVALPGNDRFEVYDYPGLYAQKRDGETSAKVRMEEEEVAHDVVKGTSNCRAFSPGAKFTLRKHDCPSEADRGYVITS